MILYDLKKDKPLSYDNGLFFTAYRAILQKKEGRMSEKPIGRRDDDVILHKIRHI